jgi:microcystin-dependent protein
MTDIQSAAAFLPAGTILPYAGGANTLPPDGWLYCDGRAIPRNVYGDLFSAISTTYGSGDGLNTFNLPGGTEVFMKGNGSSVGGGASTHKHNYATGMTISLGPGSIHSHTANAIGTSSDSFAHNHTGSQNIAANNANVQVLTSTTGTTPAVASHTHSFGFTLSGDPAHSHGGNAPTIGNEASHNHNVTMSNTTLQTDPPTNASGPSIIPPYILVWHIIKY